MTIPEPATSPKTVMKPRRKKKVVELIEVGGKKVSKTSTGKRKFHNKSKNGCDNCKRRRVKCDEGKPTCQKCINIHLECVYSVLKNAAANTTTPSVVVDHTDSNKESSGGTVCASVKPHVSKRKKTKTSIKTSNAETSDTESSDESDESGKLGESNETKVKMESANDLKSQRRSSLLISLNSPEKQVNNMDALLLPSLTSTSNMNNAHFLQQQFFLLPQLMSVSNSEKLGSFDGLSNNIASPNGTVNMNHNISVNTMNNAANASNGIVNGPLGNSYVDSPLQAIPLNASNSISSLLSMSRFSTLPGNVSQQSTVQPFFNNAALTGMNNTLAGNPAHNNPLLNGVINQNGIQTNQASIYTDSLALLNKAGINLKNLNFLGSPHDPNMLGMDLQDINNLKQTSHALKVSIAEEVLTNMQKQMTLTMKAAYKNNQNANSDNFIDNKLRRGSGANQQNNTDMNVASNSNNFDSVQGTVEKTSGLNSPIISQNTSVPSSVPITPMTRNAMTNDNNDNVINQNLINIASPQILLTSNPPMSSSSTIVESLKESNNGSNYESATANAQNKKYDGYKSKDGIINENYKASKMLTSMSTNDSLLRTQINDTKPDNIDKVKGSINHLRLMSQQVSLNLVDLKLFHHYSTSIWPTIITAGISGVELWRDGIPNMAFQYPFLMHSLLAFSATHLAREETGLEHYVSSHRIEALRLLREAVLQISPENTDALVASALILIMDSLANASGSRACSNDSHLHSSDDGRNSSDATAVDTNTGMSPSAWIFHVKGASTILTAVWPLNINSKFHSLISVDLSEFGDLINQDSDTVSQLVCFDESIADLYPVEADSPYLVTLAYLDKLHREKNAPNSILRLFSFPALLDKTFLALLMTGDIGAMRIMRSYYKLLRGYTTEQMSKVWFLEGVSHVLPQDVDEYQGGGGMHMMLDFLGGGLPSMTTTNLSEFM